MGFRDLLDSLKSLSVAPESNVRSESIPESDSRSSTRKRASSSTSAANYLNEYANTLTEEGSTIKGVVTIHGEEYSFSFEQTETRNSGKAPDYKIYGRNGNGKLQAIGAAWTKTGVNCGRYFWIIFDIDGEKEKFNAFKRKEMDRFTVFELVRPMF